MKRQLPPLHALLSAEAAARLGSFKRAGEELNVTPSAISHNIRALEDWLGARLFVRSGRSAMLTTAGARYLADVGAQLDELAKRTRSEITRSGAAKPITIQTTDSLASRWLVSRIPDFQAKHSGAGVQVITYEHTEPLRPQDADLGVLFGNGKWAQAKSTLLLEETIFPVVGRKHVNRRKKEQLPDYLRRLPILHDDNLGVSWEAWLDFAAGELDGNPLPIKHGARYNHSHMALLAAEQGHGVALASAPLAADAIDQGVLFPIARSRMPTQLGYYIVEPDNSAADERRTRLVGWLMSQAR